MGHLPLPSPLADTMRCQTETRFAVIFFDHLFGCFLREAKSPFTIPGSNPATHRSHRPAGCDCPLPLQSSFPSVCAPVHVSMWIQTPAHQPLKLREDFPRFPAQISSLCCNFITLFSLPVPSSLSPCSNSNLPREVPLPQRTCPSKQTQGRERCSFPVPTHPEGIYDVLGPTASSAHLPTPSAPDRKSVV